MNQCIRTEEESSVILMFKKTEEVICYLIQFVDSVEKERIKPEYFEPKLKVEAPGGSIFVDINWAKNQEIFKQTASDIQVLATNSAIIICFSCYEKLLGSYKFKNKEKTDLSAARNLFKLIRNSMAHVHIKSDKLACGDWNIHENSNLRLEVKCLGIVFDIKKLKKGERFKFTDIGGFKKLLDLLGYLRRDLEEKL